MNFIRHSTRRARGFTLLELLLAIVIFAIVGVLAMSGYNQLVMQRDRAAQTMQRVRTVQRAVLRMTQDFAQLEPRPVRDATASLNHPALVYSTSSTYLIELTRAGWTNPAGVTRSTLQRVGYRLNDGKLYRDYWTVLDRTLTNLPAQAQMLDKVTSLQLRFMDINHQWQTSWPANTGLVGGNPAGNTNTQSRALPLAVEITLTLQDWGEIKRVIEVPG